MLVGVFTNVGGTEKKTKKNKQTNKKINSRIFQLEEYSSTDVCFEYT